MEGSRAGQRGQGSVLVLRDFGSCCPWAQVARAGLHQLAAKHSLHALVWLQQGRSQDIFKEKSLF